MKREYIAYKGREYTVEWYVDRNEQSQPFDYYTTLSAQERVKVIRLFKRMADFGKIMDKTKFNYEGDKIYAFKPKPDRFLCFFFEGKKIIVTNAFCKKQQELPINEKHKALHNKQDYELRVKEDKYYG